MKQFVMGLALLMFVWSLPNGATNDFVTVVLQPSGRVEKVTFEQFYGDTLPPIGYVTFCQIHKVDCRPKGPFADRIQLTPARLSELKLVNDQVNTTVVPMTTLNTTARSIGGLTPSMARGIAKITCWKSAVGLSCSVGLRAHC